MGIGIDAVEGLFLVLAGQTAETGAGRVDEDQIAGVEQARFVVDQRVGRCRRMRIIRRHDPLRAEGAHVQPDRRRARPAIEQEGQRPVLARLAMGEIGDIGHGRLGRRVLGGVAILMPGFLIGLRVLRHVIPALGMDDQRADCGLVVDMLAADRDRAVAGFLLRPRAVRTWRGQRPWPHPRPLWRKSQATARRSTGWQPSWENPWSSVRQGPAATIAAAAGFDQVTV